MHLTTITPTLHQLRASQCHMISCPQESVCFSTASTQRKGRWSVCLYLAHGYSKLCLYRIL